MCTREKLYSYIVPFLATETDVLHNKHTFLPLNSFKRVYQTAITQCEFLTLFHIVKHKNMAGFVELFDGPIRKNLGDLILENRRHESPPASSILLSVVLLATLLKSCVYLT
ncbi:unnamed protein product [Acanthoscelides obtectus]|uniref:Uncharacterized protein n=1 Tax=Acanthoscelides obtectus TaxID=200917 RepID=A0A9P0JR10_ACAOB|nr:unnamed protein product [Acanthoscelides obtectus]CAK1678883.1 hypothetical protein AOBTE_LOCUS32057 [Acanthoscelides obtectus]